MWTFEPDWSTPVHIAGFVCGLLSACLIIAYNIPLAIKVARNRNGNIVSLRSIGLQYALQGITLTYAVLEELIPLTAANIGALAVTIAITVLRHKYWHDPDAASDSESRDPVIEV